ncbi:MAG TPA: inositol monophosphatase family protein, partial [Candidatus Sulfotelmatobacter sp.]|nr:inositol monophosphatase family protein [Candidatus Sulfotelmatobacter sp.]
AAMRVQRFDDIPRILAAGPRPDKSAARPRYDDRVAYDAELATAVRLAREAGQLQMGLYGHLTEVRAKGSRKGTRDLVTEADHRSEALILGGIRDRFPADGLLAEESGAHRGQAGAGPPVDQGVGRVWVVDPLDGTINYAHGLPFFCVSIALVVDGRAVVGVVFDPARGDLYEATAGGGTRRNGARMTRPARAGLADCLATIVLPRRGWRLRERAIVRATRVNRILGSSALALAYVADGRVDVYAQAGGLSAWDVAAGGLIAAEAGATVTDLAGGPWLDMARPTGKVGVAAAGAAQHAELLRLLAV